MSPALSPRFSLLGLLAGAGLAGAALLPPPALAADLDPGYADIPPVQQQVTFGSGWYVRGDIAATGGADIKAGNVPYQDAAIGPGLVAPSLTTSASKRWMYDADIGAGYQFNQYFRADAVFDYDQPITSSQIGQGHTCITGDYLAGTQKINGVSTPIYRNTTTTCTPTLTAKLNAYDVLLNGYIDLGTWYGVTPYVGAGIGASFGTATASSHYIQGNNQPYDISYTSVANGETFYQNWDRSQSRNFTNIAYAFMAGLGYAIYPHTTLEIGYRYVNLGRVFGAQITSQQARAGLRYMIDN